VFSIEAERAFRMEKTKMKEIAKRGGEGSQDS
jgi:hypothetical protein